MNEFLKTEVKAGRRKEATHTLSQSKVSRGRRAVDETTQGKPWSRPGPGIMPTAAGPTRRRVGRSITTTTNAALLRFKGNHPSPRSHEFDLPSTHPGLVVLEGLQLRGSYAMISEHISRKKEVLLFRPVAQRELVDTSHFPFLVPFLAEKPPKINSKMGKALLRAKGLLPPQLRCPRTNPVTEHRLLGVSASEIKIITSDRLNLEKSS